MPITYEAKTKWAGLVWVHDKYLNQAFNSKQNLVIIYQGARLEVPHDNIRAFIKKQKQVQDRFNPEVVHNQYGFEVK